MHKLFFHTLSLKVLFFFGFLFFLFSCAQKPPTYFPETGRDALYQRALDLRSNLRVLSIALQPGFEDLAALAYFRLGRGANAMSAYLTNGEAGESDVQSEYPSYLAAVRREEAARAMGLLGSDVRFLNLPDITAASDSAQVRELWPSDTLNLRLGRLISNFKPDLILVARDWQLGNQSLRWQIFRSEVMAAVKSVAAAKIAEFFIVADTYHAWPTPRVVIDEGEGQGVPVTINERHPRWKKSYAELGAEAARAYTSLAVQRKRWSQNRAPSYLMAYPQRSTDPSQIDAGLPLPVSGRLRNLEIQVEYLTAATLDGNTDKALPRVVTIMDSVDSYLGRQFELTPAERRTLLGWKSGLENLRCTLLGVEVDYTVTDTLLTERQLTYVFVNKVQGIKGEGTTEIFFAGLDQGWVVNEDLQHRLPLQIGEEYRLLTPQPVTYNFPVGQHPFQPTTVGRAIPLLVIHRASSKEQSFVHRNTINLSFAPKFVAEVLTPIVRMAPNERVVIRLMNISRDGVADTIEVADSLAQSFRHPFRLSSKGATKLDTLPITWQGNPDDGTYVIPVVIDGVPIAKFAARKFRAEVEGAKRVGLVTGIKNSPAAEALRRLNLKFVLAEPGNGLVQQTEALDVLIIDRRALTLQPEIAEKRQALDQFVNRGGHLIVLAQDAAAWNAKPLWEDMTLTASSLLAANMPVQSDASHVLLAKPNFIAPEDWNEWLFWRGYNQISGSALTAATVPVRTMPDGLPLIVTATVGNGKRTYVDLALHPQLMNIHAGAFRLLANLISY
ncbi:PIG-L family deacetylase [candidate division KSB1 bacterium]|nr:PIG-L family deacetylase [candidate division KSB1 bacterium]